MISINKYCRRQTKESPFSHTTLSDEQLIAEVEKGFAFAKPGYRDGVLAVPVNPEGFYSSLCTLKEGDVLKGTYSPRTKNEEPRKQVFVSGGDKVPAKAVDVILYRIDVLSENERDGNAEWQIISINASPWEGKEPIQPDTLIANHFKLSGGTETKMTAEQFETALRESVLYWKDKAFAG
jgi:hypothetical protein